MLPQAASATDSSQSSPLQSRPPPPLVSLPGHSPSSEPMLSRLPRFISHFLGYRPSKPQPPSQPTVWLWSFLGAFCGLSVIQAVFTYSTYFVTRGAPSIVPSYGASAVLIYGAIEAPLAQPQPLVVGHLVGALSGVIITKLFLLLPTQAQFDNVSWLAVSLSCAVAIVVMEMTKTMHPPAGATSVLPALDPSIRALGWYFIPIILLSSSLALAVALLLENIQRRYPVVWFTPPDLPSTSRLLKWNSSDSTLNLNGAGTREDMSQKSGEDLQGGESEGRNIENRRGPQTV